MNAYLETILFKMCDIVGADPAKINVKKDDWFMEYEWKVSDQETFKGWIIDFFKNNKQAWKELSNISVRGNKFYKKWADDFIFQYGWKIKDL
jgi:hypothetical protein